MPKTRRSQPGPGHFVTTIPLEYQLEALTCRGNDIVSKPVSPQILIKKAEPAIQIHADYCRFDEEKRQLQSMAMNFLSTVGGERVLMNFVRSSIQCRDYETLSQKLVEAIRELGLQSLIIRPADGQVTFRTEGGQSGWKRTSSTSLLQMGTHLSVQATTGGQLRSGFDCHYQSPGGVRRAGTISATTWPSWPDVQRRSATNVAMRQIDDGPSNFRWRCSARLRPSNRCGTNTGRCWIRGSLLQELVDVIEKAYSWLGTTPRPGGENQRNDGWLVHAF